MAEPAGRAARPRPAAAGGLCGRAGRVECARARTARETGVCGSEFGRQRGALTHCSLASDGLFWAAIGHVGGVRDTTTSQDVNNPRQGIRIK